MYHGKLPQYFYNIGPSRKKERSAPVEVITISDSDDEPDKVRWLFDSGVAGVAQNIFFAFAAPENFSSSGCHFVRV
jgi:hypothetical protein